jgi:predicted deacylase
MKKIKIGKSRKELSRDMKQLTEGAAGFEKMTREFIQAASSNMHMMSISLQSIIKVLEDKGVLTQEDIQKVSVGVMEARIKEIKEVEALNNGKLPVNLKNNIEESSTEKLEE